MKFQVSRLSLDRYLYISSASIEFQIRINLVRPMTLLNMFKMTNNCLKLPRVVSCVVRRGRYQKFCLYKHVYSIILDENLTVHFKIYFWMFTIRHLVTEIHFCTNLVSFCWSRVGFSCIIPHDVHQSVCFFALFTSSFSSLISCFDCRPRFDLVTPTSPFISPYTNFSLKPKSSSQWINE